MKKQVYYIEQWRWNNDSCKSFNHTLHNSRGINYLKKWIFNKANYTTVAYFRIKLKDKNG